MIKTTEFTSILQEQLGWNAARVKFTGAFVLAVLRMRTVSFPKLALALNPRVKART